MRKAFSVRRQLVVENDEAVYLLYKTYHLHGGSICISLMLPFSGHAVLERPVDLQSTWYKYRQRGVIHT